MKERSIKDVAATVEMLFQHVTIDDDSLFMTIVSHPKYNTYCESLDSMQISPTMTPSLDSRVSGTDLYQDKT